MTQESQEQEPAAAPTLEGALMSAQEPAAVAETAPPLRNLEFTIFDIETGEATLSGTCLSDQFENMAPDGSVAVEGLYPKQSHCWISGEVTAYTLDQAAAKAAPPTHALRWDNAVMAWLLPPMDAQLSTTKATKWDEIKRIRAAAEYAPFDALGYRFDGDADSRSRIGGAVQLALLAISSGNGAAFAIEWTLADNTTVVLSAAEMIAVGQAAAMNVQAAYATARALRQHIADALTVEDVLAIEWPEV